MSGVFAGMVLIVTVPAALAAASAVQTTGTSQSMVTGESGAALFKSYCASCHGTAAKGDGPLSANLRIAPADLTQLAKRNRGKFDPEKVRRAIDGRDSKAIHGGSDMPVWGDAFKRAGEGYSEAKVKDRIAALVEYLETVQER